MWLELVVGVGQLINSVNLYILLDLVGVGDWKVPPVVKKPVKADDFQKCQICQIVNILKCP